MFAALTIASTRSCVMLPRIRYAVGDSGAVGTFGINGDADVAVVAIGSAVFVSPSPSAWLLFGTSSCTSVCSVDDAGCGSGNDADDDDDDDVAEAAAATVPAVVAANVGVRDVAALLWFELFLSCVDERC